MDECSSEDWRQMFEKVSSIWLARKARPRRSAVTRPRRDEEKCPNDSAKDDAVSIPMLANRTSKLPVDMSDMTRS